MKNAKFFSRLVWPTIWLLLPSICIGFSGVTYHSVHHGLLCIRPEFVRHVSQTRSDIECSAECSRDQRCQAFSMADGPCQLFVFDKCSKSVRDCSCSRRGQVFVKQQPGLESSALCPSGYGDDMCGVKYKVMATGNWSVQKERCESESGLVIFADVTSSSEMSHIGLIYSSSAGGVSLWLGGLQPPGSAEPSGGWHWVGCNITVDSSLWGSAEPDNGGGAEDAIFARSFIGDSRQSDSSRAGLCECLSPFD